MTFRSQANIDANSEKGLVISNSITNGTLIATGLSLTNANPLHVAIVDSSGSQVTSFGGGAVTTASGNITTQNLNPLTGTATAGSTVSLAVGTNDSITVQTQGTWTGNLQPQVTVDGTNWEIAAPLTAMNIGGTSGVIGSSTVGMWQVNVSGAVSFRMQASSAITGTATLSLVATTAPQKATVIQGTDGVRPRTVLTDSSGNLQVGQTGTWTVGATIADGSDVAEGAVADAVVAAGAAGSVSAKLRRLTTDLSTVATNTGAATPAGSAIIGKVGIDQTTPGTTNLVALAANQSVNVAQINATTPLMGNGTTGTGSPRVTIASDNTAFTVNLGTGGTSATSLGKAEDAAHVSGDTGVAMLGIRDDTLNATSGTEGDYEMLHTTAEGALWVTQAPSITNGWATFNATSGDGSTALTATAQQVKATVGTVGGWYIYNPNSAATYVNFYNATSASVTVGTTNQQMVICVPATSGANVEFGNGITFATAISISATTTGGGNTAPATALECNIYYK